MQHPYLAAAVCIVTGIYLVWTYTKQFRFNRYLRDHGTLTTAVITAANLSRHRDASVSNFNIQYEDQLHHLHETELTARDSNEEYLYLVGSKVLIAYDPLRPERCILAIDANSNTPYYGIGLGAVSIAQGIYMIWEAQPYKHL